MYSEEELHFGLSTHIFGRRLFVFDSIDSTNTYAKFLAGQGGEEGTVVIADHQTAGRGRFGRSWKAESGSSLLFSLIIRPAFHTDKVGLLPFFAAVGLAISIEAITGKRCECKWPNDILINGKKCCGILMESTYQNNKLDHVIIGAGLNVNQNSFTDDLERRATSLRIECRREFDRQDIFCRTMASLEFLYSDAGKGNFDTVLAEWKDRAAIFGNRITLTQAAEVIEGIAISLTADGGLLVNTTSGPRVFYSGDVTLTTQQ